MPLMFMDFHKLELFRIGQALSEISAKYHAFGVGIGYSMPLSEGSRFRLPPGGR
jgi:hypothetical protein